MISAALQIQNPRLQTLESKLETAKISIHAQFLVMGETLKEIRDSKLYLEIHSTFEEYTEKRWHISPRRAYQLIEAKGVVDDVNNLVHIPTEGAARQLVPLKKKQREKAGRLLAKRARVSGNPITIEDAKEAVEKVSPRGGLSAVAKTKTQPKSEPEYEDVPDDIEPKCEHNGEFQSLCDKAAHSRITEWWLKNRIAVCSYGTPTPDSMVRQILALFQCVAFVALLSGCQSWIK